MSPDATSSPQFADLTARAILGAIARLDRVAFVDPEGPTAWSDWLERVGQLAQRFEPCRAARVGLVLAPLEQAYAALAGMALLDCDVFLLDAGMSVAERTALAAAHSLEFVVEYRSAEPERVGPFRVQEQKVQDQRSLSSRGRITLFTSGSTGLPKPICHDWASLARPVRRSRGGHTGRWLLTYRPHLYAGLQVFFHCLINQETLVLPRPGTSVDELLNLMTAAAVTSVSATPSYWRRLITMGRAEDLRRVPLEQITLGGEAADQALLDALARTFPRSRLVHIYATSELGRCFSVTDRRAGFPASFLDAPSDEGVELKVEDGELFVRSANAMIGRTAGDEPGSDVAGWIATGDLVERDGDRWLFAGRRHEILNVGGNKVQPLRVEQTILRVPGVRDVRVFSRSSSLVGQMVACEFVTEPGRDAREVKQAIQAACLEGLASHERPRFVEAVTAIALSAAGKKVRRPTAASGPGKEQSPAQEEGMIP
jgi:acyl-CoA synthetase (AMP-forming)/AMP-acid ligase II